DLGDPIGIALCLDTLAWIAAGRRDAPRALTLLGAVDAAWSVNQAVPTKTLRDQHDAALGAARSMVPESACRAATAKGAGMSPAEAVAFALGESPRPTSPSAGHPGQDQSPLTRREQDVAVLVARGLSNGLIAATLVISTRTVETHVQHIMNKLGVSTRAQIA